MPLYRVVDVPSDGACLFHCLVTCLVTDLPLEEEEGERGLRGLLKFKRDISNFIVKHADVAMNRSGVTYRSAIASEFGVDEEVAPQLYARTMCHTDAWGGAIDISAFVDCYGCPVRVYMRQTDDRLRSIQDFRPLKATRPLVRLLFENDHYQLVVRARPRGE